MIRLGVKELDRGALHSFQISSLLQSKMSLPELLANLNLNVYIINQFNIPNPG
jgi:hypothetical protein